MFTFAAMSSLFEVLNSCLITIFCQVKGIEMFHKQLDEAVAGDSCGLLLQGNCFNLT